MFRFKACPRCHGDILIDQDEYGWFEQCIQCGFVRDLRPVADNEQKEVVGRKRQRARRTHAMHAGER